MTLPRCAVLLLVALLAFSALAQSETLVVDHGVPLEAAASGKDTMLAVFTKVPRNQPCACGEIDAVAVGLDGRPFGAPFRIASSFSSQTLPAVAFDGVRFLVTWIELPDPPLTGLPREPQLVGAFVSEDGTVSAPFTIAEAEVRRPVIVWDGTRYVVFYTEPNALALGISVSAQGVVGTPFYAGDVKEIVSAASNVSAHGPQIVAVSGDERVAWNGQTFLIAWTDAEGVHARMLGGEPHLVASDPNFASGLQLVAAGPLFFAAWEGVGMSTAWIDTNPFGAMANVDSSYVKFANAPRRPLPVALADGTVALFYSRFFQLSQFTGFVNDYVTFVKPGRRRVTR